MLLEKWDPDLLNDNLNYHKKKYNKKYNKDLSLKKLIKNKFSGKVEIEWANDNTEIDIYYLYKGTPHSFNKECTTYWIQPSKDLGCHGLFSVHDKDDYGKLKYYTYFVLGLQVTREQRDFLKDVYLKSEHNVSDFNNELAQIALENNLKIQEYKKLKHEEYLKSIDPVLIKRQVSSIRSKFQEFLASKKNQT